MCHMPPMCSAFYDHRNKPRKIRGIRQEHLDIQEQHLLGKQWNSDTSVWLGGTVVNISSMKTTWKEISRASWGAPGNRVPGKGKKICHEQCMPWLLSCCDKNTLTKATQGVKVHSSKYSPSWQGKSVQQDLEAGGHIMSTIRKWKDAGRYTASTLPLYSVGSQLGSGPTQSGQAFLPQLITSR